MAEQLTLLILNASDTERSIIKKPSVTSTFFNSLKATTV